MSKSNKKTKLLGWSKGGDNFVHLFKNGTKLKILSGFPNLYKPLLLFNHKKYVRLFWFFDYANGR